MQQNDQDGNDQHQQHQQQQGMHSSSYSSSSGREMSHHQQQDEEGDSLPQQIPESQQLDLTFEGGEQQQQQHNERHRDHDDANDLLVGETDTGVTDSFSTASDESGGMEAAAIEGELSTSSSASETAASIQNEETVTNHGNSYNHNHINPSLQLASPSSSSQNYQNDDDTTTTPPSPPAIVSPMGAAPRLRHTERKTSSLASRVMPPPPLETPPSAANVHNYDTINVSPSPSSPQHPSGTANKKTIGNVSSLNRIASDVMVAEAPPSPSQQLPSPEFSPLGISTPPYHTYGPMIHSSLRSTTAADDSHSLKSVPLSELNPSQMDPSVDDNISAVSVQKKKRILLPHVNKKMRQRRKSRGGIFKPAPSQIHVSDKLCFIIPQTNPVRRLAAKLVLSPLAERLIILIIIVNTIMLTLYDPLNPDSVRNSIVTYSEYFFITIYLLEMMLKLISLGVMGYFRDTWNILDFLVIAVGIFSFFTWYGGLSTLRLVRILRPLRAIVLIPDLRIIVQAFLSSIGLLLNAALLFLFLLWLFSIVGLHIFRGIWRQHCYHNLTNEVLTQDHLCAMTPEPFGVIDGRHCPEGYTCRRGLPYISHGYQNFDTIYNTMLSVLHCITLEDWSNISAYASDALGDLSGLYFLCAVFFGSLFIMNLVLGITNDSFKKFKPFSKKYQEERKTSTISKLIHKLNVQYNRIKCPSIYTRFQKRGRVFLSSLAVRLGVGALILLNTIALAMEHHDMPDAMRIALDYVNWAFVAIFCVELLVKLFVLGLRDFVKDKFNVFDTLVILLSLLEIPFLGTSIFSVFRAFRLFRILRLLGTFQGLQRIVNAISKSIVSAFFLIFLFALFILIFSLMGMQLFGGKMGASPPRTNFDSIFNSLVTVFIVITRDNWSELMYETMYRVHPAACFYFIFLVIIGCFVVINLFVSVLVQHVNDDESPQTAVVLDEPVPLWKRWRHSLWLGYKHVFRIYVRLVYRVLLGQRKRQIAPHTPDLSIAAEGGMLDASSDAAPALMKKSPSIHQLGHQSMFNISGLKGQASIVKQKPQLMEETSRFSFVDRTGLYVDEDFYGDYKSEDHSSDLYSDTSTSDRYMSIREAIAQYLTHDPLEYERSLFLIPPGWWVRRKLVFIITHQYFEAMLICVIIASCVELSLDHPYLDPNSTLSQILKVCSIFFTCFFTLEAAVKITLFGFILHPTSYMRRSAWNILDLAIVILAWVNNFLVSSTFNTIKVVRTLRTVKAFRSLRTLRAFRTLRLLNKVDGLRKLVDTLLSSIPSLLYVGMVGILIYIVFGVLGIHLFAGKFYTCSNAAFTTREACVAAGHQWQNARSHFNNFGASVLTLFEIATLDSWTTPLWNMMDVTGENKAPERMASPWNALFAFAFVLMGSFFLLSLFIGVLVDKYTKIKHSMFQEDVHLTKTEERWLKIQHRMQNISSSHWPHVPRQGWRIWLYHICKSTTFEIILVILILINTIFMSLETYNQPHTIDVVLDVASTSFSIIFGIEVVLKLVAYGPIHYFQEEWMDFLIQLLSTVGAILNITLGTGSTATNVFRTFRIFRLLRILKRANGMRTLLFSLLSALPGLFNIGCLLILFVFVYSIIGFNLFGRASRAGAVALNERLNFENLWHSMVTLFSLATGEHWVALMHDYIEIGDSSSSMNCSNKRGDCVNIPIITIAYFCSFILIGVFIMTQLFAAIIVENYHRPSNADDTLTEEQIHDFILQWSKIDRSLSLFIPVVELPQLLLRIGAPLGVGPGVQIHSRLKYILSNLTLRVYVDEVHFYDTLRALAELKFGAKLPLEIQQEVDRRWHRLIRRKKKLRKRSKALQIYNLPNMRRLFFSNILDEETEEELPQTGLKWAIVHYFEHRSAIWRLRGNNRICSSLAGMSGISVIDLNEYGQHNIREALYNEQDDDGVLSQKIHVQQQQQVSRSLTPKPGTGSSGEGPTPQFVSTKEHNYRSVIDRTNTGNTNGVYHDHTNMRGVTNIPEEDVEYDSSSSDSTEESHQRALEKAFPSRSGSLRSAAANRRSRSYSVPSASFVRQSRDDPEWRRKRQIIVEESHENMKNHNATIVQKPPATEEKRIRFSDHVTEVGGGEAVSQWNEGETAPASGWGDSTGVAVRAASDSTAEQQSSTDGVASSNHRRLSHQDTPFHDISKLAPDQGPSEETSASEVSTDRKESGMATDEEETDDEETSSSSCSGSFGGRPMEQRE